MEVPQPNQLKPRTQALRVSSSEFDTTEKSIGRSPSGAVPYFLGRSRISVSINLARLIENRQCQIESAARDRFDHGPADYLNGHQTDQRSKGIL